MTTKRNKVASIFLILVIMLSVVSGAAVAQEDTTDTSDGTDRETDTENPAEEDSGDSDGSEGSSEENSSEEDSSDSGDEKDWDKTVNEKNLEIVENNDPDFQLIDNVDIYDVKITNSQVDVIVHNNGDEIAQISAANDGAKEERIEEDFELDPGEAKRVILPSADSIETGASISLYKSFDERQELGENDYTTYVIDTIAWAPNHAPDVPHPILLVFIGIGTVVLVTFARRRINNRVTKLAIRLDGILNKRLC